MCVCVCVSVSDPFIFQYLYLKLTSCKQYIVIFFIFMDFNILGFNSGFITNIVRSLWTVFCIFYLLYFSVLFFFSISWEVGFSLLPFLFHCWFGSFISCCYSILLFILNFKWILYESVSSEETKTPLLAAVENSSSVGGREVPLFAAVSPQCPLLARQPPGKGRSLVLQCRSQPKKGWFGAARRWTSNWHLWFI